MSVAEQHDDAADLASLGYNQKLDRSLGSFSSFAAGFSYISILTGMFQLFGFGFGFGGPPMFFTWLIVLAGQFTVAMCFAELSARYPIAGSVYQWSKQMSSPTFSWFTGWVMLIGSIVTIAAVAIAWNIVLPSISSVFVLVKGGDVYGTVAYAHNAILLGTILIVATTIINMLGVKLMSIINNIGVAAELTGVTVVIILLLFHAKRGPQVVLHTYGAGTTVPGYHTFGYPAAFILSGIMAAYVMYGFDTACSLAEETHNPRQNAPKAILRALAAAGTAGALLLLFALMAAHEGDLYASSATSLGIGGLPQVMTSVLGNTIGKIVLIDVAVAIFVCDLAVQTATIRMTFTLARDNGLPGSATLARVSASAGAPILPAIISGVLAIGILFIDWSQASVFLVVTSVAIALIYIAYFMVTGPQLARRLKGWPEDGGSTGLFTLGKKGVVINAIAVTYGILMTINLLWPRAAIYGAGKYEWGGIVSIVAVFVIGIGFRAMVAGKSGTIVAEHASDLDKEISTLSHETGGRYGA
jgi:urea carboxylase system permease